MLKIRWETDFKQTEIGEVPREWKVDNINSYLSKIIDYRGKTPKKSAFGIITLSAKSIKNGKIDYSKVYFISEETFKKWERRGKPKIGDVLLTTEGPLGEVAQLDRENIAISQRLLVLRGKKELLDNTYLKYYLMSPIGQHELLSRATGTAVEGIKQSEFRQLLLVLPSFEEQSRIATVLSWFDNLIENKKRQNEILEKTAMAIFKSWFVDFEPFKDEEFIYNNELDREIPKEWEVKNMGNVAYIESGNNAPQDESYFKNAKYPFVRVKHMADGATIESCDYINAKAINDYKLKLFSEGSIIIQKSGESLKKARVNLLPFNATVVNHIAIFDYKRNKNIRGYLFCWLKRILKELIEAQRGTSLPYIKLQDIQDKPLLLSPPPILHRFHELVEPLFKKIITNQKEIMVLKKTRDALLPKLVFGKLRVVEL